MRIAIRRANVPGLDDVSGWLWSCPVCQVGDVPEWRDADSLEAAWADAEAHIDLHHRLGLRPLAWEHA